MKATSFIYEGYTFKPIGNIMGGWLNKCNYVTRIYSLHPANYSHAAFYKEARKNHASCDLFEVDGKLYIPCGDCLAGITGDYKKHIKYIDEYSRWYN